MNRRELLKLGIGGLTVLPFVKNSHAKDFSPLQLDASVAPPQVLVNHLKMGTSQNPTGDFLSADSRSLILNNRRWLPVMGEFHYTRYPENEWREELLKMKMGGIDILATYVFWIHHEEIEGEFDWSGQRNLRKFIELATEVGLYSVVRLGPWCHGEVRNGGLPDWILKKPYKTRTDAPEYLAKVKILYSEISNQIKGLLWKDGGKIIGCQLENEFSGEAPHILNLKKIAIESGIDVPIYTRTAWSKMRGRLPKGELFPLFGGYAEGFWDRDLTPMPIRYGNAFMFQKVRTDPAIATDQLGLREQKDVEDIMEYPFFCCEIGGGMVTSYHRRILSYPKDIESLAVVKIGSGNNLQGFYMYHGGTNPQGKLTTLQESQATKYANDMPVKSYEFQAPLGEFGQIHPHYHSLRLQNLFFREAGQFLANATPYLPEKQPKDAKDSETLRWSVRTDGGESGLIFVNNYQRLQKMPAKTDVQFSVKLKDKTVTVPNKPLIVPENSSFFMPFNLPVGDAKIVYATAQPICKLEEKGETYLFFHQISGIPFELCFDDGKQKTVHNINGVKALQTASGKKINIHSFDEATANMLWKAKFQGRERIFLTKAGLVVDGDKLRLTAKNKEDLQVAIFPAPKFQTKIKATKKGIWTLFSPTKPKPKKLAVTLEQIKAADAPRVVQMGIQKVAEAPGDADFDKAAVWKIKIPKDLASNFLLRIKYLGDVARIYSGDTLLTDNFYNGNAFEVGVTRFAPAIYEKDLILKILPLRKDAPILLADEAKPDFKDKAAFVNS